MKKIFLLTIVSLSTIIASAQCNANFTTSVNFSTVQLTNTSSGTNFYSWSFGDGGSSSASNPTYTYTNPGTYDICLTAYYQDSIGGSCVDTLCQQVTVFQDSTGGNGCSVNAFVYGQSGVIYATNASSGASSYEWNVFDYSSGATLNTTNSTDLVYDPNYYGTFQICLTAFDSSGFICDTLCELLTMEQDSLDSTASVTILSFDEFHLFPNPSNSVLNIQFDQLPSNSHALIVDMLGREMVEVDLTTSVTQVQVAEFPRGIYMVQLFDTNNRIVGMSKFVRE